MDNKMKNSSPRNAQEPNAKVQSSGQIRDKKPSYESERSENKKQPAGDKDSSVTRLNQSAIQEGPKGGKPKEEQDKRRPA